MNCCDDNIDCQQGRNYPVRRQSAYPATIPPELPVWPQPSSQPPWRARLVSVAWAVANAAAILLTAVTASLLTLLVLRALWGMP